MVQMCHDFTTSTAHLESKVVQIPTLVISSLRNGVWAG